jgi:hypothetical protein
MDYFLGGTGYYVVGDNNYDLYAVHEDGIITGFVGGGFGVRPVITLKTGIQVSDDNTGNGYYGSPYTLKYND